MNDETLSFSADWIHEPPIQELQGLRMLSSSLSAVSDISDDDVSLLSTIDMLDSSPTEPYKNVQVEDLLNLSSLYGAKSNAVEIISNGSIQVLCPDENCEGFAIHHSIDIIPGPEVQNVSSLKTGVIPIKTNDLPPRYVSQHGESTSSSKQIIGSSSKLKNRDRSYHSISTSTSSRINLEVFSCGDNISKMIDSSMIGHHRGRSSSTTLSISTMENLDDEGWDERKRREFFDRQRQENVKSKIKQEVSYYIGKVAPFKYRKVKTRQVNLRQSDGCLA